MDPSRRTAPVDGAVSGPYTGVPVALYQCGEPPPLVSSSTHPPTGAGAPALPYHTRACDFRGDLLLPCAAGVTYGALLTALEFRLNQCAIPLTRGLPREATTPAADAAPARTGRVQVVRLQRPVVPKEGDRLEAAPPAEVPSLDERLLPEQPLVAFFCWSPGEPAAPASREASPPPATRSSLAWRAGGEAAATSAPVETVARPFTVRVRRRLLRLAGSLHGNLEELVQRVRERHHLRDIRLVDERTGASVLPWERAAVIAAFCSHLRVATEAEEADGRVEEAAPHVALAGPPLDVTEPVEAPRPAETWRTNGAAARYDDARTCISMTTCTSRVSSATAPGTAGRPEGPLWATPAEACTALFPDEAAGLLVSNWMDGHPAETPTFSGVIPASVVAGSSPSHEEGPWPRPSDVAWETPRRAKRARDAWDAHECIWAANEDEEEEDEEEEVARASRWSAPGSFREEAWEAETSPGGSPWRTREEQGRAFSLLITQQTLADCAMTLSDEEEDGEEGESEGGEPLPVLSPLWERHASLV